MRKTLRLLVTTMFPLCVACGNGAHSTLSTSTSGGTAGAGTGGHAMTGSGGSGGHMMTGSIPDPGTSDGVDNNFTDVEPNNTPDQATPLGVAAGAGVAVWVNGNTIGGPSNPADYFVFKSNAAAGQFTFDVCFGAPITAMTATLSKVVDGEEQTPPVGMWTSSMGCVTDNSAPAELEASTVYLFGLTATGGVGMYGA
jgi:hypothetical protein